MTTQAQVSRADALRRAKRDAAKAILTFALVLGPLAAIAIFIFLDSRPDAASVEAGRMNGRDMSRVYASLTSDPITDSIIREACYDSAYAAAENGYHWQNSFAAGEIGASEVAFDDYVDGCTQGYREGLHLG